MDRDDAQRIDKLLAEAQGCLDSANTILREEEHHLRLDGINSGIMATRLEIRKEFKLTEPR